MTATRRPRGSGGLTYSHPRGAWRITWPIRGQRPGSEYVEGSRIDAERVLRQRLQERDASGGVKVDRRLTVAGWIDRWLAGHVAGLSVGSQVRYADIGRRLIIGSTIGRVKLADLSSGDIERFRAELIAGGHTRRGADSVLDVLSAALGHAVRSKPPLLASNPRTAVRREPKPRRLIDPPTPAEQDAILAAVASDPVWYAAYALTIGHGLRQSELLGLRHGDRVGDRLRIERKREYRSGSTSEEPKDGSVRQVRLHPWTADALDALPRGVPAADLFAMHPHTLLTHIHGLSRQLGLRRRYSWHDLRRAYGTRIAAANSPASVSAAMGHRDYRTSMLYIAAADVVDPWTPSAAPLTGDPAPLTAPLRGRNGIDQRPDPRSKPAVAE
jgi:integrase